MAMSVREIFDFPNPVNEVSARIVAGCVVLGCVVTVDFHVPALMIPLAYGFIARAASGPTLSPLGQLVTRVVTPLLPFPPHPVAGPPKRFAQSIGATLSTAAVLTYFFGGNATVAYALVGAIAVAASLESLLGFCVGCKIFGMLMRSGVIPRDVCRECANFALAPRP